jgi:hypothetical protein
MIKFLLYFFPLFLNFVACFEAAVRRLNQERRVNAFRNSSKMATTLARLRQHGSESD